MYRQGQDFSLHTRPSKSGPVFYVQFRNVDGSWSTAKSTKIVNQHPGSKRNADEKAATAWAQRYLDSGQIVTRERNTFGQFSEDFFDWDGDYCTEKRLRGHRISREQAEKHAQSLKKHLIPYFGKRQLTTIDGENVKQWQRQQFKKGLAGATINRQTVALRVIMKAAYRQKLLRTMPVIEAVAENSEERGIFTPAETVALFSEPWADHRFFVGNLLAAVTGMRASEIVGLQEENVHPDYVEILKRSSPRWGIGPTKTGKPRIVTIPPKVRRELLSLLSENPHPAGPDRFIFYSPNRDRPMNQENLTDALYREMKRIGIDEEERIRRKLVFHSWRHGFNTLLVNARIQQQIIQSVTGHLSDAMTQRYYHASTDGLQAVKQIQEKMLENQERGGEIE